MFASLLVAAALGQADCEALKASARPAIEHANGDFVRALRANEARPIAAAYAEDGLFVLPDGNVLAGPAAVEGLYAAAAKDSAAIVDGGVETAGLACGADGLLYEWGRGWVRRRAADGRLAERGGPYLTVWKRIGAEWKIVRNLAF